MNAILNIISTNFGNCNPFGFCLDNFILFTLWMESYHRSSTIYLFLVPAHTPTIISFLLFLDLKVIDSVVRCENLVKKEINRLNTLLLYYSQNRDIGQRYCIFHCCI